MNINKLAGFSLGLLMVLLLFSPSLFAQNVLRIDGSSTVFPVIEYATSYWKNNPPITYSEFWPAEEYGIDTDKNLADYWAGLYGLDKFRVQKNLSHSGQGLRKVAKGNVDIGISSTAVRFEYPGKLEKELNKYTPHIIGYDRQAFSVSKEVYEAGCAVLTKEEIVGIFKGTITNWKGVNSCNYDREIQAVGRTVGSGTETMFRVNLFGSAEVSDLNGVDVRQGQNQMVKRTLVSSNNAIGYPGVEFITDENPAVEVTWDDGATYSVEDEGWPLGRPLYMYTWQGTSKKEAAFLRMILSDFGQDVFVEQNTDYYTLSDSEQAYQLDNLPEVE
ncbi:substrate-binding domain-containing protein [Candidatus Bipolaricaulota bacterium]|nr:substrate-binding domain-containing protein [Candidatus Bipolaricaulota bacterium]